MHHSGSVEVAEGRGEGPGGAGACFRLSLPMHEPAEKSRQAGIVMMGECLFGNAGRGGERAHENAAIVVDRALGCGVTGFHRRRRDRCLSGLTRLQILGSGR